MWRWSRIEGTTEFEEWWSFEGAKFDTTRPKKLPTTRNIKLIDGTLTLEYTKSWNTIGQVNEWKQLYKGVIGHHQLIIYSSLHSRRVFSHLFFYLWREFKGRRSIFERRVSFVLVYLLSSFVVFIFFCNELFYSILCYGVFSFYYGVVFYSRIPMDFSCNI